MTEADWLACTDPEKMLAFLRGRASDRKLRLFGVACCHRIWDSLGYYEVNRQGVVVAERYADGLATVDELLAANDATDASGDTRHSPADYVTAADISVVCQVAQAAAWSVAYNAPFDTNGDRIPSWDHWEEGERREQLLLLRDIVGNSFRPVTIDPVWLTWNDGTVVKVAQAIYDDRAFDRLPILADALEDAGCHDDYILGHCRQPGAVHVRSCWVVDSLTGRS